MEIFNVGPLELLFIFVIALIFLGPEGMKKYAKVIGREVSKLIKSPLWASFRETTQEIRELPRKLMREAGIEESMKEISKLKDSAVEIERTIRSPKILQQFETEDLSSKEDPKVEPEESTPEEIDQTDK